MDTTSKKPVKLDKITFLALCVFAILLGLICSFLIKINLYLGLGVLVFGCLGLGQYIHYAKKNPDKLNEVRGRYI